MGIAIKWERVLPCNRRFLLLSFSNCLPHSVTPSCKTTNSEIKKIRVARHRPRDPANIYQTQSDRDGDVNSPRGRPGEGALSRHLLNG